MREKLIELVNNVLLHLPWGEISSHTAEDVADHLIANGVTFDKDTNVPSKWIPVSERLPEIDDTYLVVVKFKYDFEKEYNIDTDVAIYNPYDGGYIDDCWDTFTDWDEGQQYLHVTHWMQMPEPPKEEA